jgi:chromosome segregation ATPase
VYVSFSNIVQEKDLQQELDNEKDSTNFYATLNRALHSIAAHLHRYRSELNSLEAVIVDIGCQLTELRHLHESTEDSNRQIAHGLDQTASQVKATNDFCQELEKKLSNILALVGYGEAISSRRC